jgi:hypothetical protein
MFKRLDTSNLGGYPLTQFDVAWLQESFRSAFAALADFIGDKVIISGMTEVAGTVTAGWISIGGEIVPFEAGAIGSGEFLIEETSIPRTFHDGGVYNVRIQRKARFSAGGPFNYSDLLRTGTMRAFKTAFDALVVAYNAHTHNWASITDKPAGYITFVGTQAIGNIVTDNFVTITIPDQGGTNYMIAGSLRGLSSNPDLDDDVSWVVKILSSTQFTVAIREYNTALQNLVFDFAIIKSL